jgi:phosphoglycolate phosphatase-like HAD superfamily hydrolase
MGKITSIITGAPQWVAQMEIKKLNEVPFDFFVSLHEKGFGEKPDPTGMKFVLEQLQLSEKETLYIGNSDEDALFAKHAGVDFIYLEREEHVFEFKDFSVQTIHSLDELFNL